MSPNSPCIMMSSFGALLAQKVPARPPIPEIANLGLSDSQANIFSVALEDDKSLNTLKNLLKAKIEAIGQSVEQEKAFPALALVKTPSTEAAEKLSKGSVEHFKLALRDDGVPESIAGETEVELQAVVVLEEKNGGWAEAARIELAQREEGDDEEEQRVGFGDSSFA